MLNDWTNLEFISFQTLVSNFKAAMIWQWVAFVTEDSFKDSTLLHHTFSLKYF